jgi:phage baseplate assembly protein W
MPRAIALPFSFNSTGAVSYTQDEKKIWQDRVILVLMTRFEERVMRPTFGSEVANSIFENEEAASAAINKTVATSFSQWLPQLQLIKVDTYSDPTDGYLIVEVVYRYNPRENEQRVKLKTAILTRSGEVILEVSE